MVIIFAGDDAFRLRHALAGRLARERTPGTILETFDFGNSGENPEIIAKFFETPTLLRERKIALVYAESWDTEFPRPHDPDILIVAAKKIPKTRAKALEIETFPKLAGAELAAWIRTAAKESGAVIAPAAARQLIELHGSDTEGIWNDLQIFTAWKPGEEITETDIRTFRRGLATPGDFAFIEAVLGKDRKRALGFLLRELENGEPPLAILRNLAGHFRAMLAAKSNNADSVKRFFAGRHPFWISKIKQHAAGFEEQELRTALRRLLEADRKIKTGAHPAERALEEFVLGV